MVERVRKDGKDGEGGVGYGALKSPRPAAKRTHPRFRPSNCSPLTPFSAVMMFSYGKELLTLSRLAQTRIERQQMPGFCRKGMSGQAMAGVLLWFFLLF